MVSITEYTEEFNLKVIELILKIQKEEFKIPITLNDQPDLQNISGTYQQHNGNFWIALANNQVVGTISLLDIGNNLAALRKMFVHPDFRGKDHGVARQLLQTLLLWSQQKSVQTIYLGTTEAFKAAHRFYEKNGFQLIPGAELPQSFLPMPVDTIFYRYTL